VKVLGVITVGLRSNQPVVGVWRGVSFGSHDAVGSLLGSMRDEKAVNRVFTIRTHGEAQAPLKAPAFLGYVVPNTQANRPSHRRFYGSGGGLSLGLLITNNDVSTGVTG
jgi:hypothetical protein